MSLLVVATGCNSTDDFQDLLFEDDALLIAKLERPAKPDANPEDDQFPVEVLGRWKCRHGLPVTPVFCRIYHCPRPPKR